MLAAGAGSARAEALYSLVPASGSVNLDLTAGFDINGNAAFLSPLFPANPIVIIDPGFLTHPANSLLFASDPATLNQFALVIFNLAGATPVGADLVIPGLVNPVIPPNCGAFGTCDPVTDVGLVGLLGPVTFDFAPSGQANVFSLISITSSVPEPISASLMLFGLGLLASYRRRQ